ncbi:MAG: DUF4340 domain-containing protein [Magnetococcales bacterium]|nr:DUF4340 domain-containing protein [Magnetococcales bacterium]
MEKIIRLLSILLGLQLALAIALAFSGPDLENQTPDMPFASFKKSEIDGVSIQGGEGETVVLAQKEGRWVLPEQKDFPANAHLVENLLESLGALKQGLPVATSATAQGRFKVAEKEFERKIVLSQKGQPKATLYFGTSPGMRLVQARVEGSDAIRTVAFANHQAPVKIDDWIDKDILAITTEEIETIEVAGRTITPVAAAETANKDGKAGEKKEEGQKKEISWNIAPLGQGETPNQEELARLARTLAQLRIDGLETLDPEGKEALKQSTLELSIKRKNGSKTVLKVARVEKKNLYLIQSTTREEVFRIAGYVGELFLKKPLKETLITSPNRPAAATPPEAGSAANPQHMTVPDAAQNDEKGPAHSGESSPAPTPDPSTTSGASTSVAPDGSPPAISPEKGSETPTR